MSYADFCLGKYASITDVPKKRALKFFEQVHFGIEERKMLRYQYDPTEAVRRKFSPYWQKVNAWDASPFDVDLSCPGWELRNNDGGDKWLSGIIDQRIAMMRAEESRLQVDDNIRKGIENHHKQIKAYQELEFDAAHARSQAALQAQQHRINEVNAQKQVDRYLRRKKKETDARYISLSSLI